MGRAAIPLLTGRIASGAERPRNDSALFLDPVDNQ
jgi:hypothetical protein